MNVRSLVELPEEVLLQIFQKLQKGDLRNVMLTCKTLLNLLINDNGIWRKVFCRELLVQRNSHVSFKKHPLHLLSMYQQCRISCNWRKGIFREKNIIKHAVRYMPWIQYHDGEYLLVANGSLLKCYSIDSKHGQLTARNPLWQVEVPKVKRYDIRTNDISRFLLNDFTIVCGNRDGNTSIYKIDSIRRKPKLVQCIRDCHNNGQVEVSAVELVTNPDLQCVITASCKSSLLKFWSPNSIHCLRDVDVPFNFGLRCLSKCYNNEKLAVGLNGNTRPYVLDIETGNELLSPDEEVLRNLAIRDLQWHDNNIVTYVTHSGTVQCIDLRTETRICKFGDPFGSSLYCVKTDRNQAIVTGASEHSRCVLFDMRYWGHVQIYFTSKNHSPVYSLDFDSTKLISASDTQVSVLDFNVCSHTTKSRNYNDQFEIIRD